MPLNAISAQRTHGPTTAISCAEGPHKHQKNAPAQGRRRQLHPSMTLRVTPTRTTPPSVYPLPSVFGRRSQDCLVGQHRRQAGYRRMSRMLSLGLDALVLPSTKEPAVGTPAVRAATITRGMPLVGCTLCSAVRWYQITVRARSQTPRTDRSYSDAPCQC
jgi:hypothetical protein